MLAEGHDQHDLLAPDGSFDLDGPGTERPLDESDQAARLKEEAGYADAVARGELGTVSGFLALGARTSACAGCAAAARMPS